MKKFEETQKKCLHSTKIFWIEGGHMATDSNIGVQKESSISQKGW